MESCKSYAEVFENMLLSDKWYSAVIGLNIERSEIMKKILAHTVWECKYKYCIGSKE